MQTRTAAMLALLLGVVAVRPAVAATHSGAAPFTPAPRAAAAVQQTASEAELNALTSELAAELRCPVCRGLSIEDSPTDLAVEMKAVIRERLEQGESPDEVKAYFVGRYGEWVLLKPTRSGFNAMLWTLQFALLVVAGGGLGLAFRRWTAEAAAGDGE